MKDIWNYFRDFNIISKEFTICDFNRLFFNGENNHFDTYQIPEQLNESRDIYDYVNNIIKNSKKSFYFKYKKYLDFYYKKKLPKTLQTNSILYNIEKRIKPEFSIHFFNFVVMPRLFNECLVRAAYLKYQKNSEMKLSVKLKELLKILIPEKKKGLGKKISENKSGISRLDLSVNISKNDIKTKAEERFIFYDFMYKYFNSIQNIFKKLHHICNRIFQFKDETITFKFFYNNVIKRSAILNKLIPNKFKFCEIISQNYLNKFVYNKEEINNDKLKYFEIVECYLNNEMVEYEFFELIFNMSKTYSEVKKKNYYSKSHSPFRRHTKMESEIKENIHYEKIIFFIEQVLNMNKNKKAKYNYVYPLINNHILKKKVIEEKIRKEKEDKLREIEKERYIKERKNLKLNDENFHVEEVEESEDEFDNDDDFY